MKICWDATGKPELPEKTPVLLVILRRFYGYLESEGDNTGEMSPGSSAESYPAFALNGLRENPGKNLNQQLEDALMQCGDLFDLVALTQGLQDGQLDIYAHLNAIDLARDRTRNLGHRRPALYQLANEVDP
ncbi:hypothetical protein ANN_09236 [Periplaneta americana]|uniref:Uncharacterized protein n=1 Tax=Periplaneta americana TaxID=6978 RepID=A0ABQ8TMJ2_PERAM|nr:hypothetical protein ANN_09236 [Periplaneta americana]